MWILVFAYFIMNSTGTYDSGTFPVMRLSSHELCQQEAREEIASFAASGRVSHGTVAYCVQTDDMGLARQTVWERLVD